MKVKLLMVAEIEIEGDNASTTPRELEACAEQILDGYRETARHAVGGEWPLSLSRATDNELMKFDIWEHEDPPVERCFVPPVVEESE